MIRLILSILFFYAATALMAQQEWSNLRKARIKVSQEWQKLDSLTLVPESIVIYHSERDTSFDQSLLDINNTAIRFKKQFEFLADSVLIQYRVLALDLGKPVRHLDSALLTRTDELFLGYRPDKRVENPLDFGSLSTSGNFSRGLAIGNSQNVVLNSNLNLQMQGEIAGGIQLRGAITDDNLPLQAQGDTRQLQEFDKVFIELKKAQTTLVAGDYALEKPTGYFLNYYKKLQGATLQNRLDIDSTKSLESRASVAISRGKYGRNIIEVIEGNQGPYRLRGNEGEQFFIVMAGSEKVYVDGALKQRGLDADYTIEYNNATITFMPLMPVTKESRIVVEFEYADQSYQRSLFAFDTKFQTKKTKYYFNFFNQQDSRQTTGIFSISNNEKLALINAGDNPAAAFVRGASNMEDFNPLQVQYEVIDTLLCGVQDTIYRFSNDPNKANYTVRFSEVGQGNGNYILENETTANGRVYRWIAPLNCAPQGNFAPIIQLNTPKLRQMLSFGAEHQLNQQGMLRTEVAMSKTDLNRFSNLDTKDDIGLATKISFQQKNELGRGFILNSDLGYELVHQHFRPINQYRSQEFSRDWNLADTRNGNLGDISFNTRPEHLGNILFALRKHRFFELKYGFKGLWREGNYTGNKHLTGINYKVKGYDLNASGSWMTSENAIENTVFLRPKMTISKTFSNLSGLKVALHIEQEKNRRRKILQDTLIPSSFSYTTWKISTENADTSRFNWQGSFTQRKDYLPFQNEFQLASIADVLAFKGRLFKGEYGRLDGVINYRDLKVEENNLSTFSSAKSYLGRMTYALACWKQALRWNTSYEIASGQEPKLEYNYLRVNDGEGVYQWNDYNKDDVPQVNEFETAVFQDSANFVRVNYLTSEFVRSNAVRLYQSLHLDPGSIWREQEGFKAVLRRFSSISTWQINRKVKADEGSSPWDPFDWSIADTSLVALSSNLQQTLFFNRANPIFDVRIGLKDSRNRLLITSGFEARELREHLVQTRWNLSSSFSLKFKWMNRFQTNDSEFFQNRDYRIYWDKLIPELTWIPGTSYRITTRYQWQAGENHLEDSEEKLKSHRLELEAVFNVRMFNSKLPTSIRLKSTFAQVDFLGNANSPAGFALLEGLRDGRNFLWNLSVDRQLMEHLRLSLQYEGRQTGESRIVHLGRAQIAAVF